MKLTYKSTVKACYLSLVILAIVINMTPILFIPLRGLYSLTYTSLGLLVLINFTTQVVVDLAFSSVVDKYGFRYFIVGAHVFIAAGLIMFAFSTNMQGFIIATIIFSIGGGLLELLTSPIVNAIPSDQKASDMTLLHSFYAWGQVGVILLTTFLIFILNTANWWIIPIVWAIIPIFNLFYFLYVPIAPPVKEEHRQGIRSLVFKPFFMVAFIAILAGGACEIIIAQWSSTYLEDVIKLPKLVGDIAGVCTFAVMLGVGRMLHGKFGERIQIEKLMVIGSGLTILMYLIIALSNNTVLILAACGLTGLFVSLLWPGTLVVAAQKYPLAGAWLFAILAAAGDIGASFGPWLVSQVADNVHKINFISDLSIKLGYTIQELGLRAGIGVGIIFPIIAFVAHLYLKSKSKYAM